MVSVPEPTRQKVRAKLEALIAGTATREDVNDWAAPWVREDPGYSEVHDSAVWNALSNLFGADLQEAQGQFLHGKEDFEAWLQEFEEECRNF
jgi:hypothetical protein